MFKDTLRTPLIGLVGLLLVSAPAVHAGAPRQGPADVAVVRLEGAIDDYTRDNFFKHFDKAKATGAKVIIVDLDTYGGLVTAGLDISRFIKSQQKDIHTIAFISSKAISAGALIAVACNEIVMAPAAQLGDCAPIAVNERGKLETMGEEERRKAVSPILSEFFDSAKANGYDPLLMEAMVRGNIAVYWLQNPDGVTRQFVTLPDREDLLKKGWTDVKDADVPFPVDSESSLLTVSTRSAVKLGLATEESSLYALNSHRKFNVLATFSPSAGDKVIEWLNNPFIRMLLIILFAQCLYAALHAPGHGFAEVLAVLALTVLVGVPLLTGYASWWEILVIIIGISLLALEIFVIPGFGVTGILGIVMVLFGLVMTFVGREPGSGFWPRLEGTWVAIRNGLAAVVFSLLASLFLFMWIRRYLPKLPYFNRLILTAVSGGETQPMIGGIAEPQAFRPVIGAVGQTLSELKPGGSAAFYDSAAGDNQVVSVVSDVGYIERGSRVIVHSTADNRVVVRPA